MKSLGTCLALSLLMGMAGCCLWVTIHPELPLYTGPRDIPSIKKVLTSRYGWSTLAATGICTLRSKGETRTFNFELLADRKKEVIVFTGDKTLTGTLFRLEVRPGRAALEDFTQNEPTTTVLDPSKPLDIFGGATVDAIRKGLLHWPPRSELTENKGHWQWNPHKIDRERLSIETTNLDGMIWNYQGHVEVPGGRVRHNVWVLGSPDGDRLSLAFDPEVEFDADLSTEIP